MIQYRISKRDLEALIEKEAPGWLVRAAARTADFRAKGKYEEQGTIWGEVKPVYMKLQACKCVYCERKLEAVDYGKIEQDVEHFRPKGRVSRWKAPAALTKVGVKITDVPSMDQGYHLLPYHPFNYAAACKPCNSILKNDYFPIAGRYDLDGDDPVRLADEIPLLIYPIGDFDTPPEQLICFHGVSPLAVTQEGDGRDRALVTIEFFKLDDMDGRKNLFRERACVIAALYYSLCQEADGKGDESSRRVVSGFTSPQAPHTNCARSFQALVQKDRIQAKAVFEAAVVFIDSIS